jgi:alkylation response protein AidB-like acyl-CoA dehydrogenase
MDFWLTDDQQALADTVAAFVADRFPPAALPAAEDVGNLVDGDAWRSLADLGVFSLRSDGFGVRESVLVFEQLGRGLVPGPLVGSHLAAGLVDGAAEGTTIVGLVEDSPAGALVEYAPDLDACLAFADGTVSCVPMTSLHLEPVDRSLDAGAPVWRVTSDGGSPAASSGSSAIATGDDADRLRLIGVALTAALQLGVAVGAGELATAYAKEREQFGRPIGGFQAVKHLCADMLVRAEVARAAVYAAACALDGASDDNPSTTCSAAKSVAGEAALGNGRYGIQVHGGMGFTWEVHAQRYWKRAVTLDATFGTGDEHAERVADQL